MKTALRTCWILALALPLRAAVAEAVAAAGEPTVELSLKGRQQFVNEPFEIQIIVNDFRECEPPELPMLPNAKLVLGGAQMFSSVEIINGRRRDSYRRIYPIGVTATAPGELVIPPITVVADGRKLETGELRVSIRPSDAEDLFVIEVSAGRSRLYVGQRTTLTMTLWVKPPTDGVFTLDPQEVRARFYGSNLGPFKPTVTSIGRRSRPDSKGKSTTYYVYEFKEDYIADRPGPLNFDDVEIGLRYPQGNRERNLRPAPRVQPVEVIPLPQEGRPPSFNGAVGLYDISVSAAPTRVRVGDPIELKVELFGDGPVSTLPPPLLTANPDLVSGFRLPSEALTGDMHGARRRFNVIVRPQRPEITEIPAIEYPYFDPDAERYVIARSAPIPISVAPAEQLAPSSITGPAPSEAGAGATATPLDGLRDVRTDTNELLRRDRAVTWPQVATVTLAPPAAFLITWGCGAFVRSSNSNPARRRRQAALRSAMRRFERAAALPPREQAREITAGLAEYLADRFDEPAAKLAGRDGADFLRARGVSPALIDEWATLIEQCEAVAFAGISAEQSAVLLERARACASRLEREPR
jgi:hypothetical protein